MAMSDTIADMLTRIRNANQALQRRLALSKIVERGAGRSPTPFEAREVACDLIANVLELLPSMLERPRFFARLIEGPAELRQANGVLPAHFAVLFEEPDLSRRQHRHRAHSLFEGTAPIGVNEELYRARLSEQGHDLEVTIESLWSSSRLRSVDLPTLGRPTMAT